MTDPSRPARAAVSSGSRRPYEPIVEIATEVDRAEVDQARVHGILAVMLAQIHRRRQEAA